MSSPTLLAVSVSGSSIEAIRADIESAVEQGADLVELRLDLMPGVSDEQILSLVEPNPINLPLILTIRREDEGGQWRGDEPDRIERLVRLGHIAAYIDVELKSWLASDAVRRDIVPALRRAGHMSQQAGVERIENAARRRLILSRHDVRTRPSTLQADLVSMLSEPACSVPKLAWRGRTIRDNFEAFELMRDSPRPAIVICMGDAGLPSRILARKFGAFATFASVRSGSETAPGQISVADLRQLYRWDSIDRDTAVYGVIGDPVSQSLSPLVHNGAFEDAGINAVFMPLRVLPGVDSLKALLVEIAARPWLGFRGASVTAPHKENALRLVRELGGQVEEAAERIGAVNTLTWMADGSLRGSNTDSDAALTCICEGLGRGRGDLAGLRASVLGAGGAARAVVHALVGAGAAVTVFNRTAERAELLAERFGCGAGAWDARTSVEADLVVNCTPLGMAGDMDSTPLAAEGLPSACAVFDTVYNPLPTLFLRNAAARGCPVIDGLSMFVAQAVAQFHAWTGIEPSSERMRSRAAAALRAVERG